MFLSSHSLHQLLEDENKARVTQELFDFVVDALKFHGEYDPSKQQRDDEPEILLSDGMKKIKSGDCSMQSLI